MTNHSRQDVEGLIAAALMVVSSPKEDLGPNPEAKISSAEIARDRMVAEYLGQKAAHRPQDNFELACQEGDVLSIHLAISGFQNETRKMESSRRPEGFTVHEEGQLATLKGKIAAGEAVIRNSYPANLREAGEIIDHAFGMVCNRSA